MTNEVIGLRCGNLVAIDIVGKRGNGYVYRWQCDCGNTIEKSLTHVENVMTHCGCMTKPKPCEWCGKIFTPTRARCVCCSDECKHQRRLALDREKRRKESLARARESENGKRKRKVRTKANLNKTILAAKKAGLSYGEYQKIKYMEVMG